MYILYNGIREFFKQKNLEIKNNIRIFKLKIKVMIIYMEKTIELLGKLNPKETQALIDSGEVKYLEDKTAYLVIKDKDNEQN
jgi:hypothetical protein